VVQGTVATSFPLPYPALTDGAIHCRAFGFGRTRQKLSRRDRYCHRRQTNDWSREWHV